MHKLILLKLLAIFVILTGMSCLLETKESQEPKDRGQAIINAFDASSDANFTPTDEDLKCFEHSDCQAADAGCCFHEKRMAINKHMAENARGRIRTICKGLSRDLYKEKKVWLCREGGRDKMGALSRTERVECKKEVKAPVKEEIIKDFKPLEKYQEQLKQYQDELRKFNETPGKCVLHP